MVGDNLKEKLVSSVQIPRAPAAFTPDTLRPEIFQPIPLCRYSLKELQKLTVSMHLHPTLKHHIEYGKLLMQGLRRHGLNPYHSECRKPSNADLAVTWSWWQGDVIASAKQRGTNILVMELGCLAPRNDWCTLGFNGVHGYGVYPAPLPDNGARFEQYFTPYMQPWRKDKKGYALLAGAEGFDIVRHGIDNETWMQSTTSKLIKEGWEVMFRPHPRTREKQIRAGQPVWIPDGATLSQQDLTQSLAGAAFVVTYMSNIAIDAILKGVPAVVMSDRSTAWRMASHDLTDPFYYPDRMQWCNELAWRQWTLEELADGTAWEHTKQLIMA